MVSGLVKVAGNKLVALIASEFASITGVSKDLQDLQDLLNEVTSWMSSVGYSAIESDPSIRWILKLKNISYDIADLLDEVHLEAEKHKIVSDNDRHALANCFCEKPMLFLSRWMLAYRIKEIKMEFAAIVKQRNGINTALNNVWVDKPVRTTRNRTTGEQSILGNVVQSNIRVRDLEKDNIISKLLEYNDGDNSWIVSIVGIGGSGKTTLAKLICQDNRTKQHFKDSIFWVHVSPDFIIEKLIGKLFEAIVEKRSDRHAQQHMINAVSNKLSRKKFLLVLDDAWNEDKHDWEHFMVHLHGGAPGSKILLTTRDQKVAEAVQSRNIFNLAFLSDTESLDLFLKSSGWEEEILDDMFTRVGKKVVKKCGGVPLAIKSLGGVLCNMREIDTLKAIRDSSLWKGENIKDKAFASLKLSYLQLADHLKSCFTYCCIFPKGYGINKDHLIAQWIAHGFINPMYDDQLEELGSDYFDSLVKAGFLLDPVISHHTSQHVYKMHDLIHDFGRLILQHELVTSLPMGTIRNNTYRCRYLCLKSCTEKVDRTLLDKSRALYISGANPTFDKPVKKVYCVHSAIIHYTPVDGSFPFFVLKFRYLGYLKISNLRCTKLPEAISRCWNLQTLHLINCRGFTTLPEAIGNLVKLRTLELLQGTDLETLPQSTGDCQNLRYLLLYQCEKLRELPNSIGRIKKLRVLHIVRCPSVQHIPSELVVNLGGCRGLEDPITIACHSLRTLNLSHTNIAVLPERIASIRNLECIDLSWCKELVKLPTSIVNLKGLEVLCMIGCHKLCCLPPGFGQLTRLRKLGLFVLGSGEDNARISELKGLQMISGRLQITKIKHLRDPRDAKEACLKQKNIACLMLSWSPGPREEDFVLQRENDLAVLNDLEPPSSIRELVIKGYRGPCLPYWMLEERTPTQFRCLKNLHLQQLPNLKHVRGFVELPFLKKFRLCRMPNLEELWITTTGTEAAEIKVELQSCFPVLSALIITDCPKLILMPCLPPSLERLSLNNSNELLLSIDASLSHQLDLHDEKCASSSRPPMELAHLKELRLEGMKSSFGWELLNHLTGLEFLEIRHCSDLKQLPESIRSLTSLQQLHVRRCSTLDMLPDWLGDLCSLQQLLILETPMIASLPQSTKNLTRLVKLCIGSWENLIELPEVVKYLTSLHTLSLEGCTELTVLPEWIGQLSALRRLIIQKCTALRSLPRSIQENKTLQYLSIVDCPALATRQ